MGGKGFIKRQKEGKESGECFGKKIIKRYIYF